MVRNALSYPSTDLGTLCSCDKINMWSKYKPVRYNFTTIRPSNWWKAQDGNCGIYYPSFNNYLGVKNVWDDNLNGWVYQKPTGGASQPFRLGDFAGYAHEARNPIGGFFVSPDEVQPGGFLASYAQISIYSGSSYQTSLWQKTFGTVYVDANSTVQKSGTIYPSDLVGGSTDMGAIMNSESYIEAFTQEFKAKSSIVRRP